MDDKIRKRCCFAGHSKIYQTDDLLDDIKVLLKELITKENVREFWVGNYGKFDKLSSRAVMSLKNIYPDIQLNLILPYLTSEINENHEFYYKNYDNIIIADISENTPKKYRIAKCNQYMVTHSNFIICYVINSWGGAAKTLKFAENQAHIMVFNLGNKSV